MIIAIVFASCGSKKGIVNSQSSQGEKNTDQIDNEEILFIPCRDESQDDNNYYRVLGVGQNMTMDNSRMSASFDAKMLLMDKLSTLKNRISSCSIYNINISEYVNDIKFSYYADNGCESMTRTPQGVYKTYITLEVSKGDIKNNIIDELNRISKDQNLDIDFSEEKFVNYLDDIMGIK